jgi:thiamine-monophosphate kinase
VHVTTAILENALIAQLTAGFPRSPHQLNGVRESDAELIRLPGMPSVLALTTDGIVEEIEAGLYDDPYLIGWMTVTVNASDLAAVGAQPLGLLINETLPQRVGDRFVSRLQEGIRDASNSYGLPVLGGDTNFSTRLQMSATALGILPDGSPVTRRGCEVGDRLFVSGPVGLGSAFAVLQLERENTVDGFALEYRPHARLAEGQLLRGFATSCMDSSDGIIPTLDELSQLNGIGFQLDMETEELLHPAAVRLAAAVGLPPWMMLAGPHGEFELVFTVAPDRRDAFVANAMAHGWEPLEIGAVIPERGLSLVEGNQRLDTGRIRNLFLEVDGDVGEYVRALLRHTVR